MVKTDYFIQLGILVRNHSENKIMSQNSPPCNQVYIRNKNHPPNLCRFWCKKVAPNQRSPLHSWPGLSQWRSCCKATSYKAKSGSRRFRRWTLRSTRKRRNRRNLRRLNRLCMVDSRIRPRRFHSLFRTSRPGSCMNSHWGGLCRRRFVGRESKLLWLKNFGRLYRVVLKRCRENVRKFKKWLKMIEIDLKLLVSTHNDLKSRFLTQKWPQMTVFRGEWPTHNFDFRWV